MNIQLIEKYRAMGIADVIDHERFSNISIVHHSTVMEGSTLTEIETQVLIDEGLTPKGKPLMHSLMVADHYATLQFAIGEAQKKRPVSVPLIQELNALLMRHKGLTYHTAMGTIDAAQGEFRKGNVTEGNTYFPNYDKVVSLTASLADAVSTAMKSNLSLLEQVHLSFDAHYNLVSIHPFYDGNGRTSRLLMNYIQAYYGLPLAVVRQESKVEYIEALKGARTHEDITIFRDFMEREYRALLKDEIAKFEENAHSKNSEGFRLLF